METGGHLDPSYSVFRAWKKNYCGGTGYALSDVTLHGRTCSINNGLKLIIGGKSLLAVVQNNKGCTLHIRKMKQLSSNCYNLLDFHKCISSALRYSNYIT